MIFVFAIFLIVIFITFMLFNASNATCKFKIKIDSIPESGKGIITIHWTNLKQNASVIILSPKKQRCNSLDDEITISPGAKQCFMNITDIGTYKIMVKNSNLGYTDFLYKEYVKKIKLNLANKEN